MPQPTQHSLVHFLLLWTTIISIVQAVFIVLFFTVGHNGVSRNSSAVEQGKHMSSQEQNTPLPPTERGFGKGKMLMFIAREGEGEDEAGSTVKWEGVNSDPELVSETGHVLKIQRDGYYFLNLQVTLSSCEDTQASKKTERTVILESQDGVILKGWINTETNSTGMMSKVDWLHAELELEVKINPPAKCVDKDKIVTHLDIIFMVKP